MAQAEEAAEASGEGGITLIKRYFTEGDYIFMSLPLICLILVWLFVSNVSSPSAWLM